MKYVGGVILLVYMAIAFTGCEPFAIQERGSVPHDVRRAPGGILSWHSGFMGGK